MLNLYLCCFIFFSAVVIKLCTCLFLDPLPFLSLSISVSVSLSFSVSVSLTLSLFCLSHSFSFLYLSLPFSLSHSLTHSFPYHPKRPSGNTTCMKSGTSTRIVCSTMSCPAHHTPTSRARSGHGSAGPWLLSHMLESSSEWCTPASLPATATPWLTRRRRVPR